MARRAVRFGRALGFLCYFLWAKPKKVKGLKLKRIVMFGNTAMHIQPLTLYTANYFASPTSVTFLVPYSKLR